ELKVLVDAYVRQGRLLNETNDTITVLHARLGRLDSASQGRRGPRDQRGDQDDAGQWQDSSASRALESCGKRRLLPPALLATMNPRLLPLRPESSRRFAKRRTTS